MFFTTFVHSLFLFAYLFASFSPSFFISAQIATLTTTTTAPAISTTLTRVDDADSGIAYSPSWKKLTSGKADGSLRCPSTGCFSATLDPSLVHGETWHEAAGKATASYIFSGVGVVVRGVLPNQQGAVTSLTFLIDGVATGTLSRQGTGVGGINSWLYDSVIASISGLPRNRHNLTIQQGAGSIIILDYLEIEDLGQDPLRTTTSVQSNLAQPSPTRFTPPLSEATSTIISAAQFSAVASASTVSAPPPSKSLVGPSGEIASQGTSKRLPTVGVVFIVLSIVIVLGTLLATLVYLKRAKGSRKWQTLQAPDSSAEREITDRTLVSPSVAKFSSPLTSVFSSTLRSKGDSRSSICSIQTLNQPDGAINPLPTNRYGAPSLNVVHTSNSLTGIPASLPPSRSRPRTTKAATHPIMRPSNIQKQDVEWDGPYAQKRVRQPLVVVNPSGSRSSLSTLGSPTKPLPPPPRSRRVYNPCSLDSPSLSVQVPSPCLSIDYSQIPRDRNTLAVPSVHSKLSVQSVPQSADTRSSISSSRSTSTPRARNISYFQDNSLTRWKDHAIVVQGRREFFDCAFAQDACVDSLVPQLPPINPPQKPSSAQKKSYVARQTFGHSDYPPGGHS